MEIKKKQFLQRKSLGKIIISGGHIGLLYQFLRHQQCAHNKECSKHACQKQQLEQDIVDIINHYKEIIVEMDSKINEILNEKEISYDLEIIKNKIQNAEEKKKNI